MKKNEDTAPVIDIEKEKLVQENNAKNSYIRVLEQKLGNQSVMIAKLETNIAIYTAQIAELNKKKKE